MTLDEAELRRVSLPLVSAFRTSFGTQTRRDALLVRIVLGGSEGWGECVVPAAPLYSSEYLDGAEHVIREHLLPRLFDVDDLHAEAVGPVLAPVRGHRMAKAAMEMAVLDADLRARAASLRSYLGGVRDQVECGVSVGIMDSIPELMEAVEGYLDQGYRRIKLKIEPGWDLEPVAAVRDRFGDIRLQVDANTAYSLEDVPHLARLDAFDLLLIEQPFDEEELLAHAKLAEVLQTPVCLDESITSTRTAEDALALGACSVVNIKAGRVGGYLEARSIHDLCEARDVPVWCGGMLETGLGRAANLALASLPNFTLPGDVSASSRYFHRDITEPFEIHDGQMRVPDGPGIGVEPLNDALEEVTVSRERIDRTSR